MDSQLNDGESARLIELLAPLSVVTDVGMGQPVDTSLSSAFVAAGLTRAMVLPDTDVADALYTTLLMHLGCTATTHEESGHLHADELAVRPVMFRTDFARPAEMLALLSEGSRGQPNRARIVAGLLGGFRWGHEVVRGVCDAAAMLARRVGMSERVQRSLSQVFERWDGKGDPARLRGEAIDLPARIGMVAAQFVVFAQLAGEVEAVRMLRRRAGGWFDPAVAAACADVGPELLGTLSDGDPMAAVVEAEPEPFQVIRPASTLEVAEAFADMADLKSPFTLGHSPGVANVAVAAAEAAGLDRHQIATLRLAALLHDLGRVAVSNRIWDKKGPLSDVEWEAVRLHPYHTERILSRGHTFSAAARVAGAHHERIDGSGYHRASAASMLPLEARILASADAYHAMTETRPHRPAMNPQAAAAQVLAEAEAARLDPRAAGAVVEAAGLGMRRPRSAAPGGLSEREVDVLRLVARGLSNREIGARLFISPRTAEHHVQNIYAKIGMSTRAGAALFAMEHDLLRPG